MVFVGNNVSLRRRSRATSPGTRVRLVCWCVLFFFCAPCAFTAQRVTAQTVSDRLTRDSIREQLDLQESLPCSVRSSFPVLLFDFRMHSPFRVLIPSKALRESEQLFVRVWTLPIKDLDGRPFSAPKKTHFLANRLRMAELHQSGNSFLQVNGSVATGAGEYRHFLSVDNGKGLGCVKDWKVKAKPDKKLLAELELKPGQVTDPRLLAFTRQRVTPKREIGIRVAVMLNVDNRSWRRVLTDSSNMIALAAALRKVAEDERVREVALTVFSLEDQSVFFDQNYTEIVNFQRFGIAFRQMKPGQVDLSQLSLGSEARFLADVLRKREERLGKADLILFVGARSAVTDKVSPSALETLKPGNRTKVTYLVTNPFRWRSPVNRDVIGHAVKALGGGEREIRLPADLAKAVDQLLRESMRNAETSAAQ